MPTLPALPNPLGTRVRVPLRLDPITTVGDEVAPRAVGMHSTAVTGIWAAVEALYRTGLHPGISLVVRRHGEVVINRAIGHLQLGGDELMTPTTPACLFSCSKAVTAVVLHKLVEDGAFRLDDTVATYLPEFAANGKTDVTIRQLLTHRAGLAKIPLEDPDPRLLFDVDTMLAALCAARLSGYSRQGYHAVTSGYILGAVAERVTGKSLPELLADTLRPLGCADTVTYGVPPERRNEVALSYTTGATRFPPFSTLVTRLLGVRPESVAPAMNTPSGMSCVLPAANMYASADDSSKIFQMLLDGGVWQGGRVLREDTIAEALRPAGPLVLDATLPAPIRFSAGFMLGERIASLYGVNTPRAFGHLGFTAILCWADRARDISVALINTGKSVAPEGFLGMAAVSTAISATISAD